MAYLVAEQNSISKFLSLKLLSSDFVFCQQQQQQQPIKKN